MLAVAFGLVTLFGFGVSDFLAAIASRRLGAFRTATINRTISLIILLLIFFAFFKSPGLTPTMLLVAALTGLLFAIAIVAFYQGLKVGNISIVAPIANSWAAITVILDIIFLNSSLTVPELIGIVAILVGIVLASINMSKLKRHDRSAFVNGAAYAFITMFGWSGAFFLIGVLALSLGWFMPTLLFFIFNTLYFLIYAGVRRTRFSGVISILWLLIAVSVLDITGFLAFNAGVASQDAVIVAPVASASPLVTVLLALFVLRERLDVNHKVGIAAIILGLVLISL